MNGPRRKLDLAKLWLVEQLAHDPVTTTALRAAAEAEGHSWRTVQRAAEQIGIEQRRNRGELSVWVLGSLRQRPGASAWRSKRFLLARAAEDRREARYRGELFGEQADRLMRAGRKLDYPELYADVDLGVEAGRAGWEAMVDELLDHQEGIGVLEQFRRLADLATHLAMMAQEPEA